MGNDIDVKLIGTKIRNARIKANLTQAELATKAGIQTSSISRYENGKFDQVRFDVIAKIAIALDIDVYELTEISSNKQVIRNTTDCSQELTDRDKRDIAKDLENIVDKLESNEDGPLNFNGVEIPKETKDLLYLALQSGLTQLKVINKEKYGRKNKKRGSDKQ